MPEISVIVPVYKVEKYLCRCIDSILAQTFTDFELILVDDGSPDKCGEICEEYAKKDQRVHVIHQENGGLSAARNTGIDWAFANSDSEWITFIDSDDWVHLEYLELLYKTATVLKVKISITGFEVVEAENQMVEGVQVATFQQYKPDAFWLHNRETATIACAKLYFRELLRNIRYPLGKINEDEFTTYKLLFACEEIAFISPKLYFYRQRSGSIMKSEWTIKRLDAIDAFKEQFEYFQARRLPSLSAKAMNTCIDLIYQNLQLTKRVPSQNIDITAQLQRRMRYYLKKYSKIANLSYCNAAVYYKEAYHFLSPVWNLFIFIRIIKTESWNGIAKRIKERLKCLKSL